jgi:hypothetical protein
MREATAGSVIAVREFGRPPCLGPSPAARRAPARRVDDDESHQVRRDREGVGAVLPLRAAFVEQSHVGLVGECGGLDRVLLAFVGKTAA